MRYSKLGAATLAGLLASGSTLAQVTASDDNAVEEIVVTARFREEALQQVPLSVTAFDTKTLAAMGAEGFVDYLRDVPGIAFQDRGADHVSLVIRGIAPVSGNTSPVAYYLDGIANDFFNNNPDFALFDVERVEILRGPQGTLYGQDAEGGTIKIVTNKPDFSGYHAKIEVTGDSTESGGQGGSAKAMVNLPIDNSGIAVRLSGVVTSEPGWIDNVQDGKKDLNDVTIRAGRGAIRFQPIDPLDVQFILNYQQTRAGGENNVTRGLGFGDIYASSNTNEHQENLQYTLLADYRLAAGKIETALGYNDTNDHWNYDTISFIAPPPAFDPFFVNLPFYYESHRKTLSFEPRYLSNFDGPFNFILGAYYSDRKFTNGIVFPQGVPLLGIPAPYISEGKFDYANTAIYGEAYYNFLERWKLTVGLRAFEEKVKTPAETVIGPLVMPTNGSGTYDAATPKFGLAFQATDDLMAFANVAEGYRSGGTNPIAFPGEAGYKPSYDPDTTWSYELGVKWQSPDHRVTANATAFYIDWENLQINGIPTNSSLGFTTNAGKAHSEGFEVELAGTVAPGLTIGESAGYTNAILDGEAQGAMPGSPLPYVSRWTTDIHADYRRNLTGDLVGFLRADWSYHSRTNDGLPATAGQMVPASHQVNLRIGAEQGPYSGTLFVNNLTNDHLITAASPDQLTVGRPRTFGITLRAEL